MLSVLIVSFVGLCICLYGLYIERKLVHDQNYKALCDLSDRASCTKTFLSPWGKMLGISNILLGAFFYTGMIALAWLDQGALLFAGAVSACLVSLFLAYILYTKVKTFCLLCVSLYVTNIILLVLTYHNLF